MPTKMAAKAAVFRGLADVQTLVQEDAEHMQQYAARLRSAYSRVVRFCVARCGGGKVQPGRGWLHNRGALFVS